MKKLIFAIIISLLFVLVYHMGFITGSKINQIEQFPSDENNSANNISTIRFPIGNGYWSLTDSTFCYFTEYDNGTADTTYYKCKPEEINLAISKILYTHIYASLNWAAQKEYHEVLVKIKTIQYWPSKKKSEECYKESDWTESTSSTDVFRDTCPPSPGEISIVIVYDTLYPANYKPEINYKKRYEKQKILIAKLRARKNKTDTIYLKRKFKPVDYIPFKDVVLNNQVPVPVYSYYRERTLIKYKHPLLRSLLAVGLIQSWAYTGGFGLNK